MENSFKYDAGISFLNDDIALARTLFEALSPNFQVFFYAERQQDIAGEFEIAAGVGRAAVVWYWIQVNLRNMPLSCFSNI